MARYYNPSARMITAAIEQLGFPPLRQVRGGYLTTRTHEDGRLQALYVFSWSNFAVAAADGVPGCNLCLRVSLDLDAGLAHQPEEALAQVAAGGTHTTVWFERDTWAEVALMLQEHWRPVLDAPLDAGLAALDTIISRTVPSTTPPIADRIEQAGERS